MKQIPVQKKLAGNNRYPETMLRKIIGYALVDDDHYAELNQYIWTLNPNGYAWRTKDIYMHHDIWCRLESRPRTKLDHKDRNCLNNQLSNLRPSTRSQNSGNQGLSINSTTGYKGVSWHKGSNKYVARIMVNRKPISLGYFSTALEAAKAYDTAAIKYFGEFAATNQSLGLILEH